MTETVQTVSLTCLQCGRKLKFPLAAIGKKGQCPCGNVMVVQAAEEPAAEEYSLAAETPAASPPAGDMSFLSQIAASPYGPFGAPAPLGVKCQFHPEVEGVIRCQNCHAALCATCDFAISPDLHLCAACVTARPKLSSTRMSMAIGSLVAAAFATAVLVASMCGMFVEFVRDNVGAAVLGYIILIPSVIGTVLSFGSLERRGAGNPPLIWIAIAWNVAVMFMWIVLMVIGLTMHH
jgi:hypothetical protein